VAVVIRMPRYGATMEEGTLAAWTVEEGDAVETGDLLCEIEIEKLTNELPSPQDGILRRIICEEGETVPCGTPLAVIAEADEDISGLLENLSESGGVGGEAEEGSGSIDAVEGSGTEAAPDEPRITPKARELSQELGVDYRSIRGTGLHGAVTREDVRAYHAQFGHSPVPGGDEPGKRVHSTSGKMSGVRRTIARRMMESLGNSAQTTIMMDADITGLAAAYASVRPVLARQGIKLSYTAIIVKAAATVLLRHPGIRSVIEGEDSVRVLEQINIGTAVDTGDGLAVPVLRQVDDKPLTAVCSMLAEAAERARRGALNPGETEGGCFSVTNVGSFGVTFFTPILNPPQSAILGIGTAGEAPLVIKGGIHIRTVLHLSLTYDHRLIDGAPAARFLKDVRDNLEAERLEGLPNG
jgi:pyruvate dehydrogenase E2 component (dihydrolipoamide acetyltransferase)